MPKESLGLLRTGARFMRAAVDMRRNLTSGILKAGYDLLEVGMVQVKIRRFYSFFGDILDILSWKTRRGLKLNLARDVWLSIRNKSGESYCSNVRRMPRCSQEAVSPR